MLFVTTRCESARRRLYNYGSLRETRPIPPPGPPCATSRTARRRRSSSGWPTPRHSAHRQKRPVFHGRGSLLAHSAERTYAITIGPAQAEDGQTLGYSYTGIIENWHARALASFGDGHGVWETGGGPLPFYARNLTNQRGAVDALDRLMPTIRGLRNGFRRRPWPPRSRLGVTRMGFSRRPGSLAALKPAARVSSGPRCSRDVSPACTVGTI